jgi:hypothetical protein
LITAAPPLDGFRLIDGDQCRGGLWRVGAAVVALCVVGGDPIYVNKR